MPRVALVQVPSPFLDRAAAFEVAERAIFDAKKGGADLVVLPETFIGGYPDWIWRLTPLGDGKLTGVIHERLLAAAVDLSRDELKPLTETARRAGITVVCGIHEREGTFSRTTLFNTAVVIGPDGVLKNRHRKLMPTNPERMVWGLGDASGLRVVDTNVGRVGTLLCWENYMPLARFALYAQGVEIYIAPTWDHGETWVASMRHIAREGRCWVLGNAICMQASDVPASFPEREKVYTNADEWLCPGDSIVVAPSGEVVAGPMHQERGILYADCDLAKVAASRRSFDVAGHYHRPDVFRLDVNRTPTAPVRFSDDGSSSR